MIDSRRFDLSGARRGGEQQQGKAVGSARYGDADARIRRDQRVEIAGEALDQRGSGTIPAALAHQLHCAWALASVTCFLRSARTFAP